MKATLPPETTIMSANRLSPGKDSMHFSDNWGCSRTD